MIRYIKFLLVNFFITIILLYMVEFSFAAYNHIKGNQVIKPFFNNFIETELSEIALNAPEHPCIEMKTDVLLNYVHNHRDKCEIKDGYIYDEYVLYNFNESNEKIILTLGGSTTSGYYQHYAHGETYPYLLGKISSREYSVINGGVGGYQSLQDLYKYLRDGPRFQNVEYVISLTGINELPDKHGLNSIRRLQYPFLSSTQFYMNFNQIWVDKRVSSNPVLLHLKRFFPNFMSSIIKTTPKIQDKKFKGNATKLEGKKIFKYIDAADRWQVNMERLNALVELNGSKFFAFLQPTMGLPGIQSTPKPGSKDFKLYETMSDNYLERIQSLYSELVIRCKMLDFCIDISNIAPPSGNNYYNARHHNANGNKIIAEHIWEILKKDKIKKNSS